MASVVSFPIVPSAPNFLSSYPKLIRAFWAAFTLSPLSPKPSFSVILSRDDSDMPRFFIACFKISVDTAPALMASLRVPYFSISSVRLILFLSRSFVICCSKSLVVKPASLIFCISLSQLDVVPSLRISFLLFAVLLRKSPTVLEISVNKAFASSKSPTIISHVFVHPDWAASFNVSHNWVKVFTFVAASSAFCANANALLISSLFLPLFLASASDA